MTEGSVEISEKFVEEDAEAKSSMLPFYFVLEVLEVLGDDDASRLKAGRDQSLLF